jgi:hypothetical protein
MPADLDKTVIRIRAARNLSEKIALDTRSPTIVARMASAAEAVDASSREAFAAMTEATAPKTEEHKPLAQESRAGKASGGAIREAGPQNAGKAAGSRSSRFLWRNMVIGWLLASRRNDEKAALVLSLAGSLREKPETPANETSYRQSLFPSEPEHGRRFPVANGRRYGLVPVSGEALRRR